MHTDVEPGAALRMLPEPAFRTISEPGTYLFRAGRPAEHLYFLEYGHIQLRFHAPGGREVLLGSVRDGEWVVDPAMLLGDRFTTEAQVTSRSRLVLVPNASWRCSPGLTETLTLAIAKQQRRLLTLIERSLFWEIGARLAAYLLEHEQSSGQMLPTNSVLAAELATVPELVSRKLGEFYRAGWIRLERRRLWVVDPDGLQDLLPRP